MIDQVSALSALIDGLSGARTTASPERVATTTASAGAPRVQGPSFAEVLAQTSLEAAATLRQAEATAIQGLHGRASTLEVVETIKQAEKTLSTAIAVRDRAVAAYQEISRMAI